MGKRSNFKRSKGDFYITPESAVLPLLPHLRVGSCFWEPCAGDGALVDALVKHGLTCQYANDIDPKRADIFQHDAVSISEANSRSFMTPIDIIITNPPWTREIMHKMIDSFSGCKPTWLLFDADWMHTKQAKPYLEYCHRIVSVGRVSWMGNGVSGKDNAAWYLFDQNVDCFATDFYGRAA